MPIPKKKLPSKKDVTKKSTPKKDGTKKSTTKKTITKKIDKGGGLSKSIIYLYVSGMTDTQKKNFITNAVRPKNSIVNALIPKKPNLLNRNKTLKECILHLKDPDFFHSLFFNAVKHDNIEIMKLLFDNNKIDSKEILFEIIKEGSIINNDEVLQLLISNIQDLDVKDNNGNTALINAVFKNHTKISELLINTKRVNVNIQDNNGKTALINAVEKNNLYIVDLLIVNGADVNIQDNNEKTALMFAIIKKNIEIVKLLIKKGANVNAKTNNGKTVNNIINTHKEILSYAPYTYNTNLITQTIKNARAKKK